MTDNDELMAWLHEHAELIDDPFTKGRLRAAADEIDRLRAAHASILTRLRAEAENMESIAQNSDHPAMSLTTSSGLRWAAVIVEEEIGHE